MTDVLHSEALPLPTLRPLSIDAVQKQLKLCARLPSLSSINLALRELLTADHRYTSQVAEIIRRDPSLTARLLRLVNSVYYGLSSPVHSIEEAVFYLGVRHIRQLVMVTPIIEDFQNLAGPTPFVWRGFWQHCIGTAILTREVAALTHPSSDDVDYVAGLVHDVGKITLAAAFPEHFNALYRTPGTEGEDLCAAEDRLLGLDHAQLGGLYLENHHLPETLIAVTRYHHRPEAAGEHAPLASAVQIADLLIRHARIGDSGNHAPVDGNSWLNCSGWRILFANRSTEEQRILQAELRRSVERLPIILDNIV